jgi:hypothetical protein
MAKLNSKKADRTAAVHRRRYIRRRHDLGRPKVRGYVTALEVEDKQTVQAGDVYHRIARS